MWRVTERSNEMTREEALAEKYVSRSELINKIYNDFDAQLKAKDEEIERLEALVDAANKFEEAHVKEQQ